MGEVEEEYSIQPEAPGEPVQVRIGTSLRRVTEEHSPRPPKRQCVKQVSSSDLLPTTAPCAPRFTLCSPLHRHPAQHRQDPVDVDKLEKDNRQLRRQNEEFTAEAARLRANLHAQERGAAANAAQAKQDRARLREALSSISGLQATLAATIESANRSAVDLSAQARAAGEEEASVLAEQTLDALRSR